MRVQEDRSRWVSSLFLIGKQMCRMIFLYICFLWKGVNGMSIVEIRHLSFGYDNASDPVFEDVSIHFDTAWRLGLVARNGQGKTTLLKLLAKELDAQGAIRTQESMRYFPFLNADTCGSCASIAASLQPQRWRIVMELQQLELAEDILERSYETLSKGEQVKLQLAILFSMEEGYLLIDEPTNHLDRHGRSCVADYLRNKDGFLLVSHDRVFLDGCIDHVMAIEPSGMYCERGNFSSWWENRNRRLQQERSRNVQLKKEIAQLQRAKQASTGWSFQVEASKYNHGKKGAKLDRGYIGHKSAKMMKRAKNLERRMERGIEERRGLLRDEQEMETLKLHPLVPVRELVVQASDIAFCYGTRPVFSHLSFVIRRGERTALQGANGSGKSTLFQLLLGNQKVCEGTLVMEQGLKISCVPQDTSFLKGSLNALCEERHLDESLFKSILRKLAFEREMFTRPMETYSEGQRKKVLIAASLSEKAHLYLWDEPLNYIDVFSRMQLEELLVRQPMTMVFIEHDDAFVQRVAQTVITW